MDATQSRALLELANDLSRGDQEILAAVRRALENVPRTSEDVGFYVSGRENDFENCFRKLASLLSESSYASSAEDKYVYEIFEQWTSVTPLKALPDAFRRTLPQLFGEPPENPDASAEEQMELARGRMKEEYAAGVIALERAFEAVGSPLLCFDLGEGDTILFLHATPEAALRWRDVKLGETHEGVGMSVRAPRWDIFWQHLDYALGLDLGPAPSNLAGPGPLRELARLMPPLG